MGACPRCKKTSFNTFRICRYQERVPVNKCIVCGFLWIEDKDLVQLANQDVKRLFIQDLRSCGKEGT